MRLTLSTGRRRRSPVAVALFPFVLTGALSVPALLFPSAAHAQQTAPAAAAAAANPGSVAGQAVWDGNFIYFVFQVDDTNILGTNTRPMSQPQEDDSLGVYFQVGTDRPDTPNAATHAMIVSAAGGFTFLDGDASAKALVPKPVFTIKYGVTTQGTLNRSDDRDHSYTITLAVPWSALGLDAKTLRPGTEIGFNAVARSRDAKTLTAFSSKVTTEADAATPSKWAKVILAAPDGAGAGATAAEGVLIARRVADKAKPPLIDGYYREDDWPGANRLAWQSPDRPRADVPVVAPSRPADYVAEDESAPALKLDQPLLQMPKLVMARYRIDYQADRRKITVPRRAVFSDDETLLLPDQPATGVGPWFSSDRPSWHRAELAALRKSGIDVALVQIGGPTGDGALMDEKALLALVTALRGLAAEGVPIPQIAPWFDTARLLPGRDKPDLAQESGRDVLYAAVRRWIRIVPPEFRARVTLPALASPNSAIVNAYPVFLGDGANVTGVSDAAWTDTLRARFAKDFGSLTGGTTLLFAGAGSVWEAAGNKMAAVLPATGSGKGTGTVSSFVVQPGSNDKPFAARREGETYKEAWDAAIAAAPSWVVLDSWNDFTRGTEITASRQYGLRYSDLTRIFTIQAGGLPPRAVRWLGHDAPRRMRPEQVVNTTIQVQNAGSTALRGEEGIALTYRWMQDGKVVTEGPLKIRLPGGIMPTTTARLPLGLVAAQFDASGKASPLPPGNYVVEIDLVDTKNANTYFGDIDNGKVSPPLRLSVTIANDVPDYVQIGSTTTPSLLIGGTTAPSLVRLRWMGRDPLAPDAASLIYQILSEDGATTIRTGTIPLPTVLTPGQWVTVPAKVEAAEATVPVPPAYPEQRTTPGTDGKLGAGGYRVRWLLARTQSTDTISGEYDETIAVYPADDVAAVSVKSPPDGMTLNSSALVPWDVTVTNRGATTWTKGKYAVGYHWFDPDGVESVWKPLVTAPLTKDVPPGESVKISVPVRAPRRDGVYVLAFDVLKIPDTYLSMLPVTSGNEFGIVPVRINGGPLAFVNLTAQFNTDAVGSQTDPKDGNFDGAGASFPSESFPPDRYGIISFLSPDLDQKKTRFESLGAYPSGFYFQALPTTRETSFKYGPDNANNAVACAGQGIPVEKGRYYGLHLAAAASGGQERPLVLTLTYKDGTSKTITRPVADWNHAPGPDDAAALSTQVKRTASGDMAAPCTVWHLVIPVDVTRELVSLTLPNDKAIKIFAMTLEK